MRGSKIRNRSRIERAAWWMEGKPGHTLPRFPLLRFTKDFPENRKRLAAYLVLQRSLGRLRGRQTHAHATWCPIELETVQ